MPSKKSPCSLESRVAYGVVCGLLAAWTLAAGCDRTTKPKPKSDEAEPVERPAPPPKPERRRLPPPLAPAGASSTADAEQQPCSELVNKVCALLSEGAEECGEARGRVERRPGTVRQSQCASAIDWYIEKVERPRRVRPCVLLAEAKCRAWGQDSTACVNARADADSKTVLARACM